MSGQRIAGTKTIREHRSTAQLGRANATVCSGFHAAGAGWQNQRTSAQPRIPGRTVTGIKVAPRLKDLRNRVTNEAVEHVVLSRAWVLDKPPDGLVCPCGLSLRMTWPLTVTPYASASLRADVTWRPALLSPSPDISMTLHADSNGARLSCATAKSIAELIEVRQALHRCASAAETDALRRSSSVVDDAARPSQVFGPLVRQSVHRGSVR